MLSVIVTSRYGKKNDNYESIMRLINSLLIIHIKVSLTRDTIRYM